MSNSDTPAIDEWNAKYADPADPARVFLEVERLREKARHDEAQALHNARQKERLRIARNLLDYNDSIGKIIAVTSLTREEIEHLSEND